MWESYKVNKYIDITDIYSLFSMHYEKGYRFVGEMHNFWECVYVKSGSVTVTADGYVHRLEKGDIIFHKPFEMHKFITENEKGVTHFVFSFAAKGEFCNDFCNRVYSLNEKQKLIINGMMDFYKQHEEKSGLRYIHPYKRVLESFKNDRIFIQTAANYISQIVLSLASEGVKRRTVISGESQIFTKAVGYMQSNIDKKITVEALAKYLNISVSGLKRLFLKYSGLGVHKYLLTLKIKTATEMLLKGTSVNATAYKMGFSSQDYFSVCYKRETGKCPAEIRKLK